MRILVLANTVTFEFNGPEMITLCEIVRQQARLPIRTISHTGGVVGPFMRLSDMLVAMNEVKGK